MEFDSEEQNTWVQEIPPNSTVTLNLPEEKATLLTNISLAGQPADRKFDVTANVKTLIFGTSGSDSGPDYSEQTVCLCTIDPSKESEVSLNVLFTSLNIVDIVNSGNVAITLSGEYDDLEFDYCEEEEEEDASEEEVIPVDVIQARFKSMAENPPHPLDPEMIKEKLKQKKKSKHKKKSKSKKESNPQEQESHEEEINE